MIFAEWKYYFFVNSTVLQLLASSSHHEHIVPEPSFLGLGRVPTFQAVQTPSFCRRLIISAQSPSCPSTNSHRTCTLFTENLRQTPTVRENYNG